MNEVHFGLMTVILRRHIGDLTLVFHYARSDPLPGRVALVRLRNALEVELIGVSLAVNFGHDVFVIIIS